MYFQEIVVQTSEQSFMCEGAVKSWHVGRCLCAARLQVADLWSVVNQKFGAFRCVFGFALVYSCSGELEIWPVAVYQYPVSPVLVCVLLDARQSRGR